MRIYTCKLCGAVLHENVPQSQWISQVRHLKEDHPEVVRDTTRWFTAHDLVESGGLAGQMADYADKTMPSILLGDNARLRGLLREWVSRYDSPDGQSGLITHTKKELGE